MSSVARVGHEYERHHERIVAIAALTVEIAGQTDDTVKQLTRHAIRELEAINLEIKGSSLPPDQQQQLRAQVVVAMKKHEQLLEIATRRSQQLLADAINRPLPKRSALSELSESIDDTVHALTGNIFRSRR